MIARWLGSLKLGRRLVVLASAVFLMLSVALSWFYLSQSRKLLEQSLVQRAMAVCRSLASGAAFSALVEDEEGVRRALGGASGEQDILGVAAINPKGRPIASIGNQKFTDWLASAAAMTTVQASEMVRAKIRVAGNEAYEAYCPITAGMASSDSPAPGQGRSGELIGAVRLFLSSDTVTVGIRDNFTVGAIITLIVWLASIGGTILLSRSIAGPLERMAGTAEAIARGDLTVTVTVQSNDEVGVLGRALALMAINLKENLQKVASLSEVVATSLQRLRKDAAHVVGGARQQKAATDKTFASMNDINRSFEQIGESVAALAGATDESAAAVGEVVRLLDGVSNNANTVGERVDETASAIGEMAASIRQVARNMDGLSQAAAQTTTSLDEIAASVKNVSRYAQDSAVLVEDVARSAEETALVAVQNTIEAMQRIKDTVEASAVDIGKLESRTQEIGSVLVVINEVTEQVNLLALNAAILAAQAGDQGRGFAVVADEIKNLADRTANSTREISGIIEGVQLEAHTAVKTTRAGADSVLVGVALAEQAGSAIGQMVEKAKRTVEMSKRIEEATGQQTQTVRQITTAMAQVAAMVKGVAATTLEQSTAAGRIDTAAESMRAASQETAASVTKLATESRRISHAISEVRVRVSDIAGAIDTQRSSSEVVVKSVSEIQNVAHESVETAEQMEARAGELTDHFSVLKGDVGKFRLKG